jgi:hypothetical protein
MSTDINAIITAVQNRAHGYLGEYKAMADNTMGQDALADALAKSAYMEYVRKPISAVYIGYYRQAWALASHFPEVAARVGQNGEIHKALNYASCQGAKAATINAWIKRTVTAVSASDDQAKDLAAAIKALREDSKAAKDAKTPKTPEGSVTPEEVEEVEAVTTEAHPQDVADTLMVNLLAMAREYALVVSDGAAEPHEASLQELARTLAPFINARKAA